MPGQDNLVGNVLAAYGAGRQNMDDRRRRNALAAYASADMPPMQENAFSRGAPANVEPINTLAPQPPITGSALPPVGASSVNVFSTQAGAAAPQGNAFNPGRDPGSLRRMAVAELTRLGDFETISGLRTTDAGNRADQTRETVAPMVRQGRYGDAAREAAASGDATLAQQFFQMDSASLATAKTRGEQGAAAIYAALNLPPDQRAIYMQQHRQMALDAGIPSEAFDATDWNDTATLRAVADQWLGAAKLAGDVSLQKFGDRIDPVRTSPAGMEVLPGGKDIPQTRAEALDARRVEYAQTTDQRDFDYRRQQDQIDNEYRNSRAAAEDGYRHWQMENPSSRGDVEGVVLGKAVQSGVASLTPEERAIYDRYLSSGSAGGWGAPAPQAPAPQGPPQQPRQPQAGNARPGSSQQAPVQVTDDAAFEALPPGTWFINPADNRVLRKAN